MIHAPLYRWLAIAPLLWLVACGNLPGHPHRHVRDGAPSFSVDFNAIPNAIPHHEAYSKYGNPRSYVVGNRRYHVLANSTGYRERGIASWYGTKFHGRRTSIGEPYDMLAMTAAHKTLPLPTYVEVTNLRNDHKVIVRINDRGPFKDNRIIDLSYAAATKLGITAHGTGLVEIQALDPDKYQRRLHRLQAARMKKKQASPAGHQNRQEDRKSTPMNTHSAVASASKMKRPMKLYLQIGAFAKRQNALALRARLQALSPDNIHIVSTEAPSGSLYRVHIGPLANVREVDQMTNKIAAMGLGSPRVVIY